MLKFSESFKKNFSLTKANTPVDQRDVVSWVENNSNIQGFLNSVDPSQISQYHNSDEMIGFYNDFVDFLRNVNKDLNVNVSFSMFAGTIEKLAKYSMAQKEQEFSVSVATKIENSHGGEETLNVVKTVQIKAPTPAEALKRYIDADWLNGSDPVWMDWKDEYTVELKADKEDDFYYEISVNEEVSNFNELGVTSQTASGVTVSVPPPASGESTPSLPTLSPGITKKKPKKKKKEGQQYESMDFSAPLLELSNMGNTKIDEIYMFMQENVSNFANKLPPEIYMFMQENVSNFANKLPPESYNEFQTYNRELWNKISESYNEFQTYNRELWNKISEIRNMLNTLNLNEK